MPSFDIISEVNLQEIDNAVNQTKKEIEGRYDFKGSFSEVTWDKKEITIQGDDDYKMSAMKDILQTKLHRRNLDIKAFKFADVEPIGGSRFRQKVQVVQGIEKEIAKEIIKGIKDSKLKVQAQIMEEKVRVTSKSIDELQATMSFIRGQNFKVPLQFDNMRS